jgi:2-phosphoglycerate kinase
MLRVAADASDGFEVACLLISGTAGVGKSAVAKEIGELIDWRRPASP